MVKRNLEGMLSKVYRYGELLGVEVALYVDYIDREEFLWYESKGFVGRIAEKVRIWLSWRVHSNVDQKAHPKSKRYLPSEVDRLIRSKNVYKNKNAGPRRNPPRECNKGGEKSTDVGYGCSIEFPNLPEFNLSALKTRW